MVVAPVTSSDVPVRTKVRPLLRTQLTASAALLPSLASSSFSDTEKPKRSPMYSEIGIENSSAPVSIEVENCDAAETNWVVLR